MSTTLELHNGSAPVVIDQAAILKSLNLNPTDPKTQALLLVCDRYGLDPILKHAVLIQGSLYVTRDGLLAVAHRSGQFDGIEVLEQGETPTHYTAKVAVYRKDMGRPFTYIGRYPKQGGNKAYGPEMAVKCAEVMGLRRAFNVTGVPAADERWDTPEGPEPSAALAPSPPRALPAADPSTGEIAAEAKPATTRRRPPGRPNVIDGERAVLPAEWKARLLAAVEQQGIGAETARQVCSTFVESKPELLDADGHGVPLPEPKVVGLIEELTAEPAPAPPAEEPRVVMADGDEGPAGAPF